MACAIATGKSNESTIARGRMVIARCYHTHHLPRQRNFARMREGRATTIGRRDRARTPNGWHGPRTVRASGEEPQCIFDTR
jgi:hypothetical protein